ncbi:MAG: PorT family protein, partial [Sphingobacteriales bacterium]
CALLGIGVATHAQDIKIGPEVGANYVTMSQKLNGATRETNYQVGFKVGAVADFAFSDNFSIQPGLFLSLNNGTESYYEVFYRTGAGVPASDKDRRNYNATQLQLPVYAMYKTGKEFDDPHVFFGIGPSFNLGIGGQYEQEFITTQNGVDRPQRYDFSLPYGNDRIKDRMRRFDIAANVTVGYETPFGLYFRAFYGLGLLNVAPSANSDNSMRHSGGGLSVGFLFKTDNSPRWQR